MVELLEYLHSMICVTRRSLITWWSVVQWYSGSAMDFWATGQAIDPAPGACFIPKFISLAQIFPGPV